MYVLSHRALLALLCWSDANFDGQIQQVCDYFVGAFSSSINFLIKFIIFNPLTVCDKKDSMWRWVKSKHVSHCQVCFIYVQ